MKIPSFLLVLTSFHESLYIHMYHYSNCVFLKTKCIICMYRVSTNSMSILIKTQSVDCHGL